MFRNTLCCAVLSYFTRVKLCDSVDCSLMGFSVHQILQTNLLEWVAMPSSTGSSQPRDRTWVSYTFSIENQILYHFSTIQTLDSHWLLSLFFFPYLYFCLFFFFLPEFCQENTLVIANTLFQKHERLLYTWTSPDGQYRNHIDYILHGRRWRSSIQSANTSGS